MRFTAGFDLRVKIPFQDEDGTQLLVSSASYRIIGQDDSELLGTQTISDVKSNYVEIDIPKSLNALSSDSVRETRAIELTMSESVSGKEFVVLHYYLIESNAQLVIGVNSLQTYGEALAKVPDFSNLDHWSRSDRRSHTSAMVQAYFNICSLPLGVNEKGYTTVRDLVKDDIATLDPLWFEAFCKAQIVEANHLLARNTVESLRTQGLISYSVGESTSFYRTDKPLEMAVCKDALRHIAKYIDLSMRIGRA